MLTLAFIVHRERNTWAFKCRLHRHVIMLCFCLSLSDISTLTSTTDTYSNVSRASADSQQELKSHVMQSIADNYNSRSLSINIKLLFHIIISISITPRMRTQDRKKSFKKTYQRIKVETVEKLKLVFSTSLN